MWVAECGMGAGDAGRGGVGGEVTSAGVVVV